METAAVSAQKEWLTPVVVLIPILGTVLVGLWSLSVSPFLLALTIPGGLAVTAIAGRVAYGRTGVGPSVLAGFFTLVACLPAAVIVFWASFGTSLCGKYLTGMWNAVPWAGSLLVFFAIGAWGFESRRAPVIVPLGLIAGVVAGLILTAVVPGAYDFCD